MFRLEPVWRELYRTGDLDDALTVVTTIAAMEFEVRWHSAPRGGADGEDEDADDHSFGDPPYIIEVAECDWRDLSDVLESIRDEQREFEDLASEQVAVRQRMLIFIGAGVVAAPVALEIIYFLRTAR